MPSELGLMTEHHKRIAGGRSFLSGDDMLDDATNGIFDTPNAEYWRKVSHAANALPATWRGRAFVVLYAEYGNLAEAATECGMSREKARQTLQRFAKYCTAVKPRRVE